MKPVLLAGEIFPAPNDAERGAAATVNAAARFIEVLSAEGIQVRQLSAVQCEAEFPRSAESLSDYSAVVLSDVGAHALLLTPEAKAGKPGTNRLEVLRSWVEAGGGLMMAGGYLSFQGSDGSARFHQTPVEDCLPVECRPYADGLEAPEGISPTLVAPAHPLFGGVPHPWPVVLGFNAVTLRDQGCELLARCDYRGLQHPLLAARSYGKGRTLAWMTDIGPHWLSRPFMEWSGYRPLAANMVRWIARKI
jgi:uncharacterized membrane protein